MSRGNGVGRQAPTWPEAARDRSWQREDASAGWSRQGGHHPTSPGGQHGCPVPVRLLLLAMVCLVVTACGALVTTPAAPLRPPPRLERDLGSGHHPKRVISSKAVAASSSAREPNGRPGSSPAGDV